VAVANLIHYVEKTNRKLTRFLESVKYSDFISGFSHDNKLGESFKEVNRAFDEVLEAFRLTRAEKEEHLQYLNTVLQHISVGILTFDSNEKIYLINNALRKLLRLSKLGNLSEIKKMYPQLYHVIKTPQVGEKTLVTISEEIMLAVHSTQLILRGKSYTLVSFQNIQSELQTKEIEAWQNLTRVLRHEIMNSIAPINTLVNALQEILENEVAQTEENNPIDEESLQDFREGLKTIESRARALTRFVDAYRNFNNIPLPKFEIIVIEEILKRVHKLLSPELNEADINFEIINSNKQLTINADPELLEMILINLLRNAIESVKEVAEPTIKLRGGLDSRQKVYIDVIDNGPGIPKEKIEQIFVPFYTTKEGGTGIGLSLSRQIMQLHDRSLLAKSKPHQETVLTLKF